MGTYQTIPYPRGKRPYARSTAYVQTWGPAFGQCALASAMTLRASWARAGWHRTMARPKTAISFSTTQDKDRGRTRNIIEKMIVREPGPMSICQAARVACGSGSRGPGRTHGHCEKADSPSHLVGCVFCLCRRRLWPVCVTVAPTAGRRGPLIEHALYGRDGAVHPCWRCMLRSWGLPAPCVAGGGVPRPGLVVPTALLHSGNRAMSTQSSRRLPTCTAHLETSAQQTLQR